MIDLSFSEKRAINKEKGKARIKPELVDWNQSYQYDLRDFNRYKGGQV